MATDILKLTSIDNLRYAVRKSLEEEVYQVQRDLKKLPNRELVKNGLIMINLMVSKTEVDADDGNLLLKLSNKTQDSVFSPIFRRGDPLTLRFTSEAHEQRFLSFKANVSDIGKRSMILSLGFSETLDTLLKDGKFRLEVAPDDKPFTAMLEAIEKAKDIFQEEKSHILAAGMQKLLIRSGRTDLSPSSVSNQIEDEAPQKMSLNYLPSYESLRIMLGSQKAKIRENIGYDHNVATVKLNEQQSAAVDYALKHNVSVIHGPPGTGKSTTIVALVEQLLVQNERIVICGPSNVSVDVLLERLEKLHSLKDSSHILRLGNKHKVDSKIHEKYSIYARLRREKEAVVIRDEIRQAANYINGIEDKKSRSVMHKQERILELKEKLRKIEARYTESYVKKCKVLACTLHGILHVKEYTSSFQTLIIDEVSQCLLPQCYIPSAICTNCNRLVVAGDNQQLPPTVKSKDSRTQLVLKNTLFQVLLEHHGDFNRKLLNVQYRMSNEIMKYTCLNMYSGKLIAHETVANRRLVNNNWVKRNPLTESAVVWIDTKSVGSKECFSNFSRANSYEARIVKVTLKRLKALGVRMEDVAIISPYKYQIGVLGRELGEEFKTVEISSIDGFQGREKSVIIISMVRSGGGNMGFVADSKRMNVAITRARELVCIIGDS